MADYIYLRHNTYYEKYNAIKLGCTSNLIDRDRTYVTYEIERGKYIYIIKLLDGYSTKEEVEKNIQDYFKTLGLHIQYLNGGTEYFHVDSLNYIFDFLNSNQISFEFIDIDKINQECIKNDSEKTILMKELINPYDYQQEIIDISLEYFEKNHKGILQLTCGVGKTLISLWISKYLDCKKILIGVPNITLLNYWKDEVQKIFDYDILVISKDTTIDYVNDFLNNAHNYIIISSYHSNHKIPSNLIFDMKILDEVHHLASSNKIKDDESKQFIKFLDIPTNKQLGLTATIKNYEIKNKNNQVISNNDENIFGKIIVKRNLEWAIKQNIVCDYKIITPIIKEQELENLYDIIDEKNISLLVSAYIALKTLINGSCHHQLIYCNSIKNSRKIYKLIEKLLNKKIFEFNEKPYISVFNSEINKKEQINLLENFSNHKKGILITVYSLGEGWDCPILDSVLFAENMTSNIRIFQSSQRPSRKDSNDPSKISKIILPIINDKNWIDNKEENNDFKKIKEVFIHMSNEDSMVEQKLIAYNINISRKNVERIKENVNFELGEIDDETTKDLRFRIVNRQAVKLNYKDTINSLFFYQIRTKKAYEELTEINPKFVKDPETYFGKNFTSWSDYLSIPRDMFYTFEECRNTINELLKIYPELKKLQYNLDDFVKYLNKIDDKFPHWDLFTDFYNIKTYEELKLSNDKKENYKLFLDYY